MALITGGHMRALSLFLLFALQDFLQSTREHPAVVICISNQGSLVSMLTLPCCRSYPITEKQMVETANGGSQSQRHAGPHSGRCVWRTWINWECMFVYHFSCVAYHKGALLTWAVQVNDMHNRRRRSSQRERARQAKESETLSSVGAFHPEKQVVIYVLQECLLILF